MKTTNFPNKKSNLKTKLKKTRKKKKNLKTKSNHKSNLSGSGGEAMKEKKEMRPDLNGGPEVVERP